MDKKEIDENKRQARERYQCYKVGDIAVKLLNHGVSEEDIAYIMQGGENVTMKPYEKSQKWLDGAMDRLAERLPRKQAILIRQDCACCLTGIRNTIARKIYKDYPTIEERFEALSHERRIIGGNAWTEGDDYFITFWYAKPETGYTCACLKHIPDKPMNMLWCECCGGHIKHYFEIALGVKATATCITSVLSSCGENACLFKLNIVSDSPTE